MYNYTGELPYIYTRKYVLSHIIHTWHIYKKPVVIFFRKTHPGSAMVRRGNASRIKSGNSHFPTSMALAAPFCASTSPVLVP